MVALTANKINILKNSLDWQFIEIRETDIEFRLEEWIQHLQRTYNISVSETDDIRVSFNNFLKIANESSSTILRWMCHGHIGLTFLWHTFAQCIYRACHHLPTSDRGTQVHRSLKAGQDLKFKYSVSAWIRRHFAGQEEFPVEITDFIIRS